MRNLGRLHGPTALGHLEGLRLWGSADMASVLPERHTPRLLANSLEIRLRTFQAHFLDGLRRLIGVLVVNLIKSLNH